MFQIRNHGALLQLKLLLSRITSKEKTRANAAYNITKASVKFIPMVL